MTTLGKLIVALGLEGKEFNKGLSEAAKDADSFGSKVTGALGTVGKVAAGVAIGGITAVGGAIFKALDSASEAQSVFAQTEAAVKSTGGAAGLTAQDMADLASGLSAAAGGASNFGDEAILAGENLLATFTEIKGPVFKEATGTLVDMAEALHTDVSGGAIQLGKALNDPIKGITALTRVGVTFTDKQKDMIKSLQETGDMAGAQRIILAELNKEFGGSAAAAANTFAGKLATLKDRFGELVEGIGNKLLPIFTVFIDFLNGADVQSAISAVIDGLFNGIGAAIAFVTPAVNEIIRVVGVLVGYWSDASEATSSLTEQIGYFIDTLIGTPEDVVGPFQNLALWLGTNIPSAIQTASDFFTTVLTTAIGIAAGIWNTVLLPVLSGLVTLWTDHLAPALGELGNWFLTNLPVAINFLGSVWNTVLLPALGVIAGFLTTTVFPALGILVDWLKIAIPVAISVAAGFWTNTLQPAVQGVIDFFNNTVIPTFNTVVDWLDRNIPVAVSVVSGFWTNTLQPAVQKVIDYINGSVIPAFGILVDKLNKDVIPAIKDTASATSDTLLPAMQKTSNFITGTYIPAWQLLIEDYVKILTTAVRLLAETWTGMLGPALDNIYNFIVNNLWPSFQRGVDLVKDSLTPAIAVLGALVGGPFATAWLQGRDAIGEVESIIHTVVNAINSIQTAVNNAIGWIQNLIDKLDDIHMPSILKQSSPSMLEQSILDTGAAFQFATGALSPFNRALGQTSGTYGARINTMGGSTGGGVYNIEFNIDARGADKGTVDRSVQGVKDALGIIGQEANVRVRLGAVT